MRPPTSAEGREECRNTGDLADSVSSPAGEDSAPAGSGRVALGGDEIRGRRGGGRELTGDECDHPARGAADGCDRLSGSGVAEGRGGWIRGGGRVATWGGRCVAVRRSDTSRDVGELGRSRDCGARASAAGSARVGAAGADPRGDDARCGERAGSGVAAAPVAGASEARASGTRASETGGGAESDGCDARAAACCVAGGDVTARAARRRSAGTESSSIQSPRPRRVTSVWRVTCPACSAAAISDVASVSSVPSGSWSLQPSPPTDDGGGLSGGGRSPPAAALASPGARPRSELERLSEEEDSQPSSMLSRLNTVPPSRVAEPFRRAGASFALNARPEPPPD